MILVKVLITPNGVYQTSVEANMDEENEARVFYENIRAYLLKLDHEVKGIGDEN